MVQMLTRLKPLGRPKQPRPTAKLHNTTIRDFGGGLNVVDSEQNLTSKFSPVFDNMVTYTDRRVGPRFGYEMWLKLRTGAESSGAVSITITTALQSRIVIVNWTAHPFIGNGFEHVTISGWDLTFNSVVPEMMNRTHGIRRVIDVNSFEIVLSNSATSAGTSAADAINYVRDMHLLGGEPIEAKYFANYVVLWSSIGEILLIDRNKGIQRIWSQAVAFSLPNSPIGWTHTELVASDIFGKELICSNGRDKPLALDFTRAVGQWVLYLVDPGNLSSNDKVPAFDACKSAFRFFTIHDTEPATLPEHATEIRIAAKDTAMVFSDAPDPADAVDINMSKITASPEQTVRAFAVIKDALLVITPTATTMMKYNIYTTDGQHDPQPVDTLNGFGTSAPRTVVEIGSDVFMVDFNGVPSAKLSSVSNAVVPERVSNYVETMLSQHIGHMRKETMRLKAFGFYDSKNKSVHFYLPKFDTQDIRELTSDPFYFDTDMANNEFTKRTLIVRMDDHHLEEGDTVTIAGATGFGGINAADINGTRTIISVLGDSYVLVSIGTDLPLSLPQTSISGGGTAVVITPIIDGTIGYIYHYVPQLKLFAWSRFKTSKPDAVNPLKFNCGCGTLEGRAFLFTPDGYMMRYGSPDHHVHADWLGMYDHVAWVSGQAYTAGERVLDASDGLVYKCLADVTTVAADFATARTLEPDSWEEYKGEAIDFAWELPWSDFGARQATKGVRFVHIDASGEAQFTLSLFADNIYKNASTGQLQPARQLTFVPNEAGAYGYGTQVYGAGRRTREQKLWQMPMHLKLLKARVSGSSTQQLSINAMSFMYHRGSMVRG